MYNKYYNYVRAIVGRMINGDADDIAQMAFLKLSKYEYDEQHAKAFLVMAAKNLAIDYIRKSKRERNNYNKMALDLGMLTEPTTEFEQNNADLAEIHTSVIEFIHEEIKNLPTATRRCFEMFCYRDMQPKQIAVELNISINTVYQHISIAREKLKIEILFNKKDALQLLTKRPKI